MPIQIERCPGCDEPVPLGFGRPKTYCSPDCRREMARQRRDLDRLEAELADARQELVDNCWPGAYFWRGTIDHLERAVAEARPRVKEALR